jgi:hypothetical protein
MQRLREQEKIDKMKREHKENRQKEKGKRRLRLTEIERKRKRERRNGKVRSLDKRREEIRTKAGD